MCGQAGIDTPSLARAAKMTWTSTSKRSMPQSTNANTKFQSDVLPNLVAREARVRQQKDAAKKRQASLDKKAKKLAKPE